MSDGNLMPLERDLTDGAQVAEPLVRQTFWCAGAGPEFLEDVPHAVDFDSIELELNELDRSGLRCSGLVPWFGAPYRKSDAADATISQAELPRPPEGVVSADGRGEPAFDTGPLREDRTGTLEPGSGSTGDTIAPLVVDTAGPPACQAEVHGARSLADILCGSAAVAASPGLLDEAKTCVACCTLVPRAGFTSPQWCRAAGTCRWCCRYWSGVLDYAALEVSWRSLNGIGHRGAS